MFTGLIEKTVTVKDFFKTSEGAVIKAENPFDEIKLGDSICLNGVCLTVIEYDNKFVSFEISKETLSAVNYDGFKKGALVNLERAMLINSRLGGHIVSGHIDGVAKIGKISQDGFSYRFEFFADKSVTKYIVKKGSVAINGISLTVNESDMNSFAVEIIPHTYKETNLSILKTGDFVNVETDIFAKYIEKFLYLKKNDNEKSSISIKMLEENGYL